MRRPPLIPTLAAALVVATTASLGAWQLRRADEKAVLQQQRDAAQSAPPIAVAGGTRAEEVDGRRVSVTGRLVSERTVYIDNRTRQGVAGFHVVTPLRLAGSDRQVLVLRGWVASDPARRTHLPPVPAPEETVTIEGLAQPDLAQTYVLGEERPPGPGDHLWQQASIAKFERWTGETLVPLVVRQLSDQPDGLARDWVEPGTGVDKHRGYAAQWFAMCAATVVVWFWFGVLRRRPGARG